MEKSIVAAGLATGSLWGGALLTVGLANLVNPGYGSAFLRVISSVYPGANTERSIERVLLGAAYGFTDGFIAGALLVGLYRAMGGEPAVRRRHA